MNDSSENGAEHRSQQPSPRKTTLPTNYVATTADDLFERTRTVAVPGTLGVQSGRGAGRG